MGLIRSALRKLIDHEVGVIGGELDQLIAAYEDLQSKLLSYEERFERLRARAGMRVTRANRAGGGEFAQLLEREQRGGNGRDDDELPDFRTLR